MSDTEAVKSQIWSAFAVVKFPGDWCLRGSNEGNEPYLVQNEFSGKSDWRVLDPGFLDQAPGGYGTALCFFSDEAFRFYLPAYLLSDMDGRLHRQDPVFHLTNGLTNSAKIDRVNPQRYGERTWFEAMSYKFAVFDRAQAAAIVAYLQFKREPDGFEVDAIDQALENYWLRRAAEGAGYSDS